MRIDNLCDTLAGNSCYIVTITANLKTYLTSQDELNLFKKSDDARAMLKKKLDIYEARHTSKEHMMGRKDGSGNHDHDLDTIKPVFVAKGDHSMTP